MTRTGMEQYRQQLLALADQKQQDFAGIEDDAFRQTGGENLSNVPTHPGDVGSDIYDQQIALRLLASSEERLEQIVAALDRIEDGSYGVCSKCAVAIGAERLVAVPYTEHCIDCARREERRGTLVFAG